MTVETKLITLYGEPLQTVEFYTKFEQLTGYNLSTVVFEDTECYLEVDTLTELSTVVPNTIFEVTQTDIADTANSWRYTCFNGRIWYEEAKLVFNPPIHLLDEARLTNPELFI